MHSIEQIREELRTELAQEIPGHMLPEIVDLIAAKVIPLRQENVDLENKCQELHDGINVIANEAALHELRGAQACAERVKSQASKAGLTPELVDFLLQDHMAAERVLKDGGLTGRDKTMVLRLPNTPIVGTRTPDSTKAVSKS